MSTHRPSFDAHAGQVANLPHACCWPSLLVLLFGLGLLLAEIPPARAQNALPAADERIGPISPEKRAELQRELAQYAKTLEAQSAALKIVAKLVGPAVVHIEADVVPSSGGKGQHVEEAGAGAIIEWKGNHYVLTNRHVIRASTVKGIKIHLADGRRIYPTRVLQDADTDIAVLPVDAKDLVAAPLGDSDKMEIGDFVLAIGSPFGLRHSVTFGIVSAKGRRDLRLGDANVPFQDFIQTDAAIHPGNSGGPLVNLRGEVIGINTAIASKTGHNEGVGFAIPSNMFLTVARQLIEKGKVARAFLGVNLNSKFGPATAVEAGLPALMGAQVNGVTKGSPAETAKLQAGDVVLEFNGVRVEDDAHLVNMVALTEIGTKAKLLVFRDRKTIALDIEVADRSKF
jgi:serine protease Do